MIDLLNLGHLYVSDFLAVDERPRSEPYELRLVMDDGGLVHLAEQPPASLMWGERYWYRSGTTATMRHELADVADFVQQIVDVGAGDVWVDIASNDGTLLSHVPSLAIAVGVDPVSFAGVANRFAELIVQEPFTMDVAERIVGKFGDAKVVTCIAMFYDLLDPTDFLAAVHHLLNRAGVLVLQLSYTSLMLRQLAFDNICHEHARYYTLTTLTQTLNAAGLVVVDCQLNAVNGGSMRVVVTRDDAEPVGSTPWRGVAEAHIESILHWEAEHQYNRPWAWRLFADQVHHLRTHVRGFILNAVLHGQKVWGYGASTKGNTLLQHFGLDAELITAIAERQEQKWGLRTVGTDIPIVSEDEMRCAQPDYLLVLPWHFQSEIVARERAYLEAGGRLIFPCPAFEVIGG